MAARNAPQTLLVKRKRTEASVDALVVERADQRRPHDGSSLSPGVEHSAKRARHARDDSFIWRRIATPHQRNLRAQATPSTQPAQRTFHVDRTSGDIVLVETKATAQAEDHESAPAPTVQVGSAPEPVSVDEKGSSPRKRPGARSALRPPAVSRPRDPTPEPTEDRIREFAEFANEVEENEATEAANLTSPSRWKPRAPKLRFKDRHPELTAATSGKGASEPDAMEIDTDEYVYDTYVREVMILDADGLVPEPQGSVGIIVITEEDEEYWFGEDESDKEFDTDEDDENAEGYYANDYPEDEVSSDDEFDRDPYRYHHEGNDEYEVDDDALSDGWGVQHDNEDEPPRRNLLKPKVVSAGYWGKKGE